LEYSWKEKFMKNDIPKKQVNVIKNELRRGFSEIREHTAAILIQIITVSYDEQFEICNPIDYFTTNKDKLADDIPLKNNHIWFDENINNQILRICINYLITPLDKEFFAEES